MEAVPLKQHAESATGELDESLARLAVEDITKSPPALDDLPNELLLHIISYLPAMDTENFNLSSLIALSQTNQLMHDVVVEALYTSFNSFFCDPFPFLRTVMANKKAAQSVRSVELTYGPGVHPDRLRYASSLEDRRAIKAGFRSLGLADWKDWTTECNQHRIEQETLFAAILMFLPNITSLNVDDGELPYRAPKWLDVMNLTTSQNKPESLHDFAQLRSIRIDANTLKLRHLAPLFRLPSLHTLNLIGLIEFVKPVPPQPGPFKWPPYLKSSSIKELLLDNCLIDTRLLRMMTDSCQALETLRYQHKHRRVINSWADRGSWTFFESNCYHGYDADLADDGVAFLMYPDLSWAVARHSDSLTELCIRDASWEMGASCLLSYGKCDLKAMAKLKSLRIPVDALPSPSTSIESLPDSLTHLTLTLCTKEDMQTACKTLEHWAPRCGTQLPVLKQITLKNSHCFDGRRYGWARLEAMYADLGIQLVGANSPPVKSRFFRHDNGSTSSLESADDVSLYSD